MKRYSTANRIAGNILSAPEFGVRASLLGEYMTAPGYFVGNPDYTGFLLHHCVHAMDLVPWLMGEPVRDVTARRFEMEPGKLLLHVGFGFASGALATVVMGTHQSRGTPMEWWQVMGDHKRVEVRNVHEVRYYRSPGFKAVDPAATLDPGAGRAGVGAEPDRGRQRGPQGLPRAAVGLPSPGARRAVGRTRHRRRRAGDAGAGGDGPVDGYRRRLRRPEAAPARKRPAFVHRGGRPGRA